MITLLPRGGSCDFAQDGNGLVIPREVAESTPAASADRSPA
jgi:hypothetical protein